MGQRYSRLTVVPCGVRLRVIDCIIQGASLIASPPPLLTYIPTYEYLHYRTSPDGVEVLTMPNGLYQLARRLCIVLNQSKLSDVTRCSGLGSPSSARSSAVRAKPYIATTAGRIAGGQRIDATGKFS